MKKSYLFTIRGYPDYEGYTPKSLGHEICKYCGNTEHHH